MALFLACFFGEDGFGGWWLLFRGVARVLPGFGVLGGGRRCWFAGWMDGWEVGFILLDEG